MFAFFLSVLTAANDTTQKLANPGIQNILAKYSQFFVMIFFILIFYFLLIRPQNKQRQKLAEMIKQEKSLREEAKPKAKKEYIYPWRRIGYISSGVGLTCIGAGLYYNSASQKTYDESVTSGEEYLNAEADFDAKWAAYEAKYATAEDQARIRNTCYIAGGTAITFGIVSIFFIRKPILKNTSMIMLPDKMLLSYQF